MIGRIISHYKIVEKLGEGGMGVVYKAEDVKLERSVALKFLASHLLEDEEGRERFLREAKAAAALDHNNICTVHEIDEADGQTFIAMAFIEGPSLKEKIEARPLKLEEALDVAAQTARGLQAAHKKDIVHRDIKPANLMLTEEGQVKIMDFGLAQLTDRTKLTKTGSSLGTPAYMSPEQTLGQKVDHRSDIWSLGVVLYEMVAGQLPFKGDVEAALAYSIVNEEPEPLTALRTGVGVELDRIVGKALAKDPDDRYQHVDEVLVDLRAANLGAASGRTEAVSASGPAVRSRFLSRQVALVLALIVVATGCIWWQNQQAQRRPRAISPPVLKRLTSDSGLTYQPALSADGKLLAYASDCGGDGNLDIWVLQLGGGQPVRLTSDEADDDAPTFSPDGTKIAFRSARKGGGIYLVDALGGEPRLLAERSARPKFSPDGRWISYVTRSGGTFATSTLFLVSPDGGPSRRLPVDVRQFGGAVWAPSGQHILVAGNSEFTGYAPMPDWDWWLVPVDGGAAIKTGVVDIFRSHGLAGYVRGAGDLSPIVWRPESDDVLFTARLGDSTNVWRIPLSSTTGKIEGAPERLTFGAGVEAGPSAAQDGRLVFATLDTTVNIWALPIDPNRGKVLGEMRRLTNDAAVDHMPSISADGKKLLFRSNRSGNFDLWLKDLETGDERALTSTPERELRGVITHDGEHVVYKLGRSVYLVSSDGGLPKMLCEDCGPGNLWSRSWGGTKVLYWRGSPFRIAFLDWASGETGDVVSHPEYNLHTGHYSPDGEWIAFNVPTGEGGFKLFIAPLRDGLALGEEEWIAVTDGSTWDGRSFWSPDGELLYFVSNRDGFLCIWAQHLDARTKQPSGEPFAVQHFHGAGRSMRLGGNGTWGMPLASDKLVVALGETTGNIWLAEPADAQ